MGIYLPASPARTLKDTGRVDYNQPNVKARWEDFKNPETLEIVVSYTYIGDVVPGSAVCLSLVQHSPFIDHEAFLTSEQAELLAGDLIIAAEAARQAARGTASAAGGHR